MDKLFELINALKVLKSKNFNLLFKNTDLQLTHLNKITENFQNLKVIHIYEGLDETKRIHFFNG